MKLRHIAMLTLPLVCSATFAASTPWLVRGRVIDVVPYPSSGTLNLIGGQVNSISTRVVPELDFSYFFTPNIAAELILATARHSVAANGTTLGRVGLGSANLLPPTITAQYHFMPGCKIDPYVGAGLNYTYFYNVSYGTVATSVSYKNTFGPALQVGADYAIDDHWLINADIKKIFIRPDVTVRTGLGTIRTNVHIDPLIIGLGVGYRF